MIVDCHTHMAVAGHNEQSAGMETVDVRIVLAEMSESSREVNKHLSKYVSRNKEKLVGFAFAEPTRDDISVKKLRAAVEKLGVCGFVVYCSGCGFHPCHSRAMRFYDSVQEMGLPVFFHNGRKPAAEAVLDYSQSFLLDEAARTFPDLKIVIGSMGMPFSEQTLSMVSKHKNVFADLTISPNSVWQVYNLVVAAYERGVMDKLLFGSGFPRGNASECIETLLGFNKLLADTNLPKVPRGNIRNIIERDALKLLGIREGADAQVHKV